MRALLSRWDRLCFDHGGGSHGSTVDAKASGQRKSGVGHATGGSDTTRFLLEWLRDPIGTAAVAPSGKSLASLITREIGTKHGPVLELGPGTGVFTESLIARGVAERDLTLVECNPGFARLLRQRYPAAKILDIDAARLDQSHASDKGGFGAVVCGLGLRNMEAGQIEAIVRAAFGQMAPDAAFYLFTYGRRCSIPATLLDRLGLSAERTGTVLRNLPPASVFRICRR